MQSNSAQLSANNLSHTCSKSCVDSLVSRTVSQQLIVTSQLIKTFCLRSPLAFPIMHLFGITLLTGIWFSAMIISVLALKMATEGNPFAMPENNLPLWASPSLSCANSAGRAACHIFASIGASCTSNLMPNGSSSNIVLLSSRSAHEPPGVTKSAVGYFSSY